MTAKPEVKHFLEEMRDDWSWSNPIATAMRRLHEEREECLFCGTEKDETIYACHTCFGIMRSDVLLNLRSRIEQNPVWDDILVKAMEYQINVDK